MRTYWVLRRHHDGTPYAGQYCAGRQDTGWSENRGDASRFNTAAEAQEHRDRLQWRDLVTVRRIRTRGIDDLKKAIVEAALDFARHDAVMREDQGNQMWRLASEALNRRQAGFNEILNLATMLDRKVRLA